MPPVPAPLPGHLLAANLALMGLIIGGNFVLLPLHSALICISVLVVYVGSHRSLLASQASHAGIAGAAKMEYMQRRDAYMFPIMAGCTLCGLFALFKFLDKDMVNLFITAYISVVSTFVLASECEPVIGSLVLRNYPLPVAEIKLWQWDEDVSEEERKKRAADLEARQAQSWFVWLFACEPPAWLGGKASTEPPKWKRVSTTQEVRYSHLASLVVGVAVTAWYVYSRHWVANNLIGAALSLQAIESLSLGTFQNGAYLLVFLFFYDIFFVFGTDVMVTVAKSVDAPIKLVFLKQFAQQDSDALFSMLGLGDIVLPGVFVAMLLRFDYARHVKTAAAAAASTWFPHSVFNVAILFYAMGLWCTVFIMHVFKHAQPALLYLVPAVLLASGLAGLYHGCLGELWRFEETAPEDKKKEEEEVKKQD